MCNRIVCHPPKNPRVLHVGTYEDHKLVHNHEIGIEKPVELKFNNYNEIKEYVKKIDPFSMQGVILFLKNHTQVKVLNDEYMKYSKLRSNEPSIKFRYLQIRHDIKSVNLLKKLYPEHIKDFDLYESILHDICINLHNFYMQRFVHKEQVKVSNHEYRVMRLAHDWYHGDRENRRVSKDLIKEIVNSQNAYLLNQLIKKTRAMYKTKDTDNTKNKRLLIN